MKSDRAAPRLFAKNRNYRNTVLNWHKEPENELDMYGEAFWNAAKKLLENEYLDERPIASFDASVIVYLYRHALELFLKQILIGPGASLIDPCPSSEAIIKAGHCLTKLLPDVRRIFEACGWSGTFGEETVPTFDDFIAIVEQFEDADPSSFCFRYPIKKDLTKSLDSHFTFSVRHFARVMDEVLTTLSGACLGLPEIADARAEAAYEAQCQEIEYGEHPDYE